MAIDDAGVTLRSGTTRGTLLWVAPEALDLRIENIGLEGSVLAPKALVDVDNAAVDGTLVGASVHGDGVFNHYPFAGCLPQP